MSGEIEYTCPKCGEEWSVNPFGASDEALALAAKCPRCELRVRKTQRWDIDDPRYKKLYVSRRFALDTLDKIEEGLNSIGIFCSAEFNKRRKELEEYENN